MADMMDLDDLDLPAKAPARTSRFAPRNSKIKPKTETAAPSLSLEEGVSTSSLIKKEKDELVDSTPIPVSSSCSKVEFVEPDTTNGAVRMDIETVLEEEEEQVVETEDQLVREIDVFYNPSVDSSTQLYVLQYPLRQCWRPYELDDRCEQVRVKSTSAEVEVDLLVEIESENYDHDADERKKMTKQVLSSSWKPPLRTGYVVGVLKGNKLHLSPVHAVVQLRPSMQHCKSGASSKKKVNTNGNLEGGIVKSEELNKDTGECWIPLKYHGAKSDISSRYVDKMVDREGMHINFSMSPYEYLNSLCPPGTSSDKLTIFKGSSYMRRLLKLPLEERFKTWLCEGCQIHRFATFKHLAPDESDEVVLEVLQNLAQLVQGLWVPKSLLVYGTNSGVEVLARDFVLLLFSKNLVISYKQIPKGLPGNVLKAIKDVLNIIAVDRHLCEDWKFKEPPDTSFIKHHQNVYEKQQRNWNIREEIISDVFKSSSRKAAKNSSRPV